MFRFSDLTNFNCSPFLEFDRFGAILARNLSNLQNVEQKSHHVSHFGSSFWRFDKFEPKSVRICEIFKTSNKKKLSNYQNEARDWIFEEKIRIRILVRKCQIIKTIAYQATWPWPLSNGFCQISKYIPYFIKKQVWDNNRIFRWKLTVTWCNMEIISLDFFNESISMTHCD